MDLLEKRRGLIQGFFMPARELISSAVRKS
jgi:hypothetical protein